MVPLQHIGPALATSLAAMFNVVGLGVMLARRGLLRADARLRKRLVRIVLATGVMAVAIGVTQHLLFAPAPHGVARMLALTVLISVGLLAFAGAAQLLGAGDVRELGRLLQRRRASRAAAAGAIPPQGRHP